MKFTQWIYSTVLIGMIPILWRIIMFFLLSNNNKIDFLSISDIAFYGLCLNVININNIFMEEEILNLKRWKIKSNYNSILLIIFIAFAYTLSFIEEANQGLFSSHSLTVLILTITGVSLVHSLSVNNVLLNKKMNFHG